MVPTVEGSFTHWACGGLHEYLAELGKDKSYYVRENGEWSTDYHLNKNCHLHKYARVAHLMMIPVELISAVVDAIFSVITTFFALLFAGMTQNCPLPSLGERVEKYSNGTLRAVALLIPNIYWHILSATRKEQEEFDEYNMAMDCKESLPSDQIDKWFRRKADEYQNSNYTIERVAFTRVTWALFAPTMVVVRVAEFAMGIFMALASLFLRGEEERINYIAYNALQVGNILTDLLEAATHIINPEVL